MKTIWLAFEDLCDAGHKFLRAYDHCPSFDELAKIVVVVDGTVQPPTFNEIFVEEIKSFKVF